MSKEFLNHIEIPGAVGNERRLEMLNDIFKDGTFLPKTVEYKDIDEAFTEWVKSLKIISDDGREFPTMTLFSNQRFSEYSQSWEYVDSNNNLLLNFKTITRENTPQYGKIQSGLWNVPGERFYTMIKKKVLDDNGSESFLVMKMRQPVAIDFNFKVSVFTTKYESINEFNTIMNKAFAARQCYICPNGHFMAMNLDGISDESQYNINDRQFYAQTYQIKVLGYIVTEDDFRVDEVPLKYGTNFGLSKISRKKADVELEEYAYIPLLLENPCGIKTVYLPQKTGNKIIVRDIEDLVCEENESKYYYKPMTLSIDFLKCVDEAKISDIDFNFVVTEISMDDRIRSFEILINDEPMGRVFDADKPLVMRRGDTVQVKIKKGINRNESMKMSFNGYCPDIVIKEDLNAINEFEEIENG